MQQTLSPKIKAQMDLWNKEVNKEHKRYSLDIETMNYLGNNKFKMGLGYTEKLLIGLYDGETYKQFDSFKEVLKFLYSQNDVSIVFAHNGGKYDFLYLMDTCVKGKCHVSDVISLGSSIIFTINYKKKKIIFRDSFKLLPSGLEALAKSYLPTLRKMEMNYDKSYFQEEIEEYLRVDCLSLFEVLKTFESDINAILYEKFGDRADLINIEDYVSIASLAFYILNRYYLKGITKNYFSIEEEEFIRKGYFGGRVEIYKFTNLEGNLNYFDVNSLYPSVMNFFEYPIGQKVWVLGHESIMNYLRLGKLGMIEAEIEQAEQLITILPYKKPDKKGTIFPTGKWKGIYTSVELLEAMNNGAKITFIKGIFLEKKKRIFKEFVDDFYSLKQNSTGSKREIAKLLLNSCYGKTGQRRTKQKIIMEKDIIDKDLDLGDYEALGESGFYYREEVSYRNRKVNPIYACFVTAYARIYLFRLMKKAGFDKCYYCDTDSLVMEGEYDKEFVHDSNLGMFKKEYESVLKAYFVSPKLYALRIKEKYSEKKYDKIKDRLNCYKQGDYLIYDVIKGKGVDKNFMKKMSYETFVDLCKTKNFKFVSRQMVSFKQKFNLCATRDNDTFVNLQEIPKDLALTYNKRVRRGNVTKPIKL